MKIQNQGKIPKEIESLSLQDQRHFFHSLREESEVHYIEIYSEYRQKWKELNERFEQVFERAQSAQKDYV